MKKAVVQTLSISGHEYGQVSNPNDLMKAQNFLHDRLGQLTHDFINNHRDAEIAGFSYALGAGNAFTIEISKPGRVYSKAGRSFELMDDVELEIAEADDDHPRLDLVIAVLDEEVDAELDLIPFVRLRTPEEFDDDVAGYPPQNISAATELHDRAVVQIRTGTAAAVPNPPTLASNEIPLYMISVAPGAQAIQDADVLDMRDVILTLRKLNDVYGQARIDIDNLTTRVGRNERIQDLPIDLTQIFGSIRTLGEILSLLQSQVVASRDVPEIRYDRPKVALTDHAASKIVATGGVDTSVPCVDIEVGGKVNFGDAEVVILPQNFADQSVNPRFETVGSDPGHVRRSEAITLDNVTQIASDGAVDFLLKTSQFAAGRQQPACAARDDRYIEVFGGLAQDDYTALSIWETYDTENDTLVTRMPLTSLPTSDRPAMFPYGDGVHMLLIAGSSTDDTPPCYKINTTTGAVTAISGTLPEGIQFVGDLITAGKIFVVALKKEIGGVVTTYWEFNTGTNLFTQIGATGNIPTPTIDMVGGCVWHENEFVLVAYNSNESGSGKTYVFDRTSAQWTLYSFNSPYGGNSEKQLPLSRFQMANVNGRPMLVGGRMTRDTDETQAKVWELFDLQVNQKRQWVPHNATFSPVHSAGLCSLIGPNDLPTGNASLFGGQTGFSRAIRKIYSSEQAGLIAAVDGEFDAVSISPTSSFVQFEIEPYEAAFEVAAYSAVLSGRGFTASDIKVEVSFDDGDTWTVINGANGSANTVTNSDDPGTRRLRVTLYQNKTSPPVVSYLHENLDSDGPGAEGIEGRLIIRYDAPDEVMALYIDRDGVITLSETIEPSTPSKCLIHKVTPNGSDAPDLKNYINRRRAHIKYTGVAGAGAETVDNELAVPVRYVDARAAVASGGHLYILTAPTVAFDEEVTIAGVTTGDTWVLELEG